MESRNDLTQIMLPEKVLRDGLIGPSSSDDLGSTIPVAAIRYEPADLERKVAVRFQDSYDELDYVKVAVLRMRSGRIATLLRHCRSRDAGTAICLSERLESNVQTAIEEVLDALNLGRNDILWVQGERT